MLNSLHKVKNVIKSYLSDESGQAITEYIALVALFLGLTLMMVVLLDVFADYGWRILGLVGMDYP
jgi:hypothetical protein